MLQLFHIESRPVGTTGLFRQNELPSNRQVEHVLSHDLEAPHGPAGLSDRRASRRLPLNPPAFTKPTTGVGAARCIYRPPVEVYDPDPGLKESRRLYLEALR